MVSARVTIFSIQTMCGLWCAGLVDFGAHLGGDLRRVGRAGAEDDLRFRREVADGVDQMRDALLAGDAADEEDVGNARGRRRTGAARWCRGSAGTRRGRCRCR